MSASSPQVLVVGAGLAGLTAAHWLQAHGLCVALVEATDRAGGRIEETELEGFRFEPTLQFQPGRSPELRALEAAVGTSLTRVPIEQAGEGKHGELRIREIRRPPSGSFVGWRARRLRDLLEIFGELLDARAPERAIRLDDRSIDEFARVYLGRRSDWKNFARWLEAGFGLPPSRTSRQLLFQFFDEDGRPNVCMMRGLPELTQKLAASLEDFRTSQRVEWVSRDGRKVGLSSGTTLDVEATVLATPASDVGKLVSDLTPTEQDFFLTSSYEDRACLALVLKGPFACPVPLLWKMKPPARGKTLAGILNTSLWNEGPADRSLILLAATNDGARKINDTRLERLMMAEADRMLPGLRDQCLVQRFYRRTQAAPGFDVGRYRQIARIRDAWSALPDARLFLAGDYLSGPHAEAAAGSGRRAADEVTAALNGRASRS